METVKKVLWQLVFSATTILSLIGTSPQKSQAEPTSFQMGTIVQSVDFITAHDALSDQTLLSLYRTSVAPSLKLKDTLSLISKQQTKRRSPGSIPPPSLRQEALLLMKSIAFWQHMNVEQSFETKHEFSNIFQWLEVFHSTPAWAHSTLSASLLDEARGVMKTLKYFSAKSSLPPVQSEEYYRLTSFLDQRYPDLMDSDHSWVSLGRQGRVEIMQERFDSYWNEFPDSSLKKNSSQQRFFKNRIEAVLFSHLRFLSKQLQIEAENVAGRAWRALSTWKETWIQQRGLLRLCGTWKWIIHNHQNHGDHKMTMTFPHPSNREGLEALPAKIITMGDLVYLRWEFAGGIQEDSLLFSKKDMRLEGYFRNSTGPYGNVSGSKIKPCTPFPEAKHP